MELEEYDLDNICRSCLSFCSNMESVFEHSGCHEPLALNELIMECTQVQVLRQLINFVLKCPLITNNNCTSRFKLKKLFSASFHLAFYT